MARATRSKLAAKSSQPTETTESTKATLEPSVKNPPKLFVLPEKASKDARIITLPNPATSAANRYYHCPETGIYELVKVAAPRSVPRSLLCTSQRARNVKAKDQESGTAEQSTHEPPPDSIPTNDFSKGYVTRSADMFVATPMDFLFFLLPILAPLATKDHKQMFLTFDDHMEKADGGINPLLAIPSTAKLLESRMAAVCETMESQEESMYKFSVAKLTTTLSEKAQAVLAKGLPPSMEEKFVRQALQVPVLSVKREESGIKTTDPFQLSTESQQSSASSSTSIAVDDTANSTAQSSSISAPEEVINLLRMRTAFQFILSSYLPPHLRETIWKYISSSQNPIKELNFTPLDTHLKHLDSLREQARALRSLSDNVSRKRGLDDDEAIEAREEKKRKKEEEEKKKKTASRAVKNLKKVDTSGMKKMSSFFTKAVPKK
ncbi:hypothetical protein EJ08DRAFT_595271 [Tothia fuscella]|uniref:Ribonuclease H2 subunit B n=1 Tax=Tothia fuscella TaxID=1048955 RepID=A0A9P4TVI8_9PEZI|nr:hypothetical protein EJ08DRAFT_595271 [Tothia fuscella]